MSEGRVSSFTLPEKVRLDSAITKRKCKSLQTNLNLEELANAAGFTSKVNSYLLILARTEVLDNYVIYQILNWRESHIDYYELRILITIYTQLGT